MTAGAIGSFIGTPAEISLIRMTSDGRSAKSPLKQNLSDLSCKYNVKHVTHLDLKECSTKVTFISAGFHWNSNANTQVCLMPCLG